MRRLIENLLIGSRLRPHTRRFLLLPTSVIVLPILIVIIIIVEIILINMFTATEVF